MPVEVDVACEFRYRAAAAGGRRRSACWSRQSGETADTLAALRYCARAGPAGRCRSSTCRKAAWRARATRCSTVAGPEIGVASTKAFTAQLAVLACLAIAVGAGARQRSTRHEEAALTQALLEVPGRAAEVLDQDDADPASWPPRSPRRATCSISAAAPLYPHRAGRRAEAEGDQLHPRRGLCRRRDEARADRADRRPGAGHRAGADRTAVREDRVQPAGGRGARRPDHRVHRRRRRRAGCAASPSG